MVSFGFVGLAALGLSADGFAVSLGRGAAAPRPDLRAALGDGAIFGSAEAAMALLGWLLAGSIGGLVDAAGHWVALILLTAIGSRMIFGAYQDEPDAEAALPNAKSSENPASEGMALPLTVLAALGTSLDSAIAGGSLHFAGAPLSSLLLIGGVSAACSTLGFLLGPNAGRLLGKRAELFGGGVLILVGFSIWAERMLFRV